MYGNGKDLKVKDFRGDSITELVKDINSWLSHSAAEYVIHDVAYSTKERRHYAVVVYSRS